MRYVLGILLLSACSGAHVPEPLDAGSEPVDAAPALEVECTSREDVCTLLVRTYDRAACGFVTPNCPPFGLDLSTCGPLLDASRTCADVQEALLLCRRC